MKQKQPSRDCAYCGAQFIPIGTRARKYCKRACYFAARDNDGRIVDGTKRCARCSEMKLFADFPKQPSGRAGIGAYCKACASLVQHEWRGYNSEERKPYVAVVDRKRRTLEEKSAYFKAYRAANHEKVLMWNRMRVHRQRAAGVMPHPYDIGRMLCMQDARCVYCTTLPDQYHIDHKMPVSRGGTNDEANLQLLCPTCNMSKGAKTDEEYRAYLIQRGVSRKITATSQRLTS